MGVTITRLKGALYGDDGRLFVISHGRRLLLAKCKPEISVYEKATQVNMLGVIGHREKVFHCGIVFLPEPEVVQEVNDDFIRSVTSVELLFDVKGADAVIETIEIGGLTTDDLDYTGDWKFEAVLPAPLAEKLLRYLRK